MQTENSISMSGSVGVAHAAELHATTLEVIEKVKTEPVTFDFSEVRNVDASILQLLLATKSAVEDRERQMVLDSVPENVADSITAHGALSLLVEGESNTELTTRTRGNE